MLPYVCRTCAVRAPTPHVCVTDVWVCHAGVDSFSIFQEVLLTQEGGGEDGQEGGPRVNNVVEFGALGFLKVRVRVCVYMCTCVCACVWGELFAPSHHKLL